MLIGLGCQKQVGKDTVAAYLARAYDFHVTSFATPLKELGLLIERHHDKSLTDTEYKMQFCAWAYKYGMDKYEHDVFIQLSKHDYPEEFFKEKENGKYRKLLQWLGTDLIRNNYDKDFWIKAFALQILNLHPRNIWTVVTDVRFPNEKKFIEKYGSAIRILRERESSQDCHESETALLDSKWSYIIDNNGSLENLTLQIEDLMSTLLGEMEIEYKPTLKELSEVSDLFLG